MKKPRQKKHKQINQFDLETLRRWKKVSTKRKLQWLESALRFGKLKKF